jgi:DNA-binding response OmpR family regulator
MARDNHQTPTILVVENNGDVLDLVTSIVAAQGWHPLAAVGLTEARELLRQQGVDAIVTDLSLDDGDGLELVREVRSSSVGPLPMLVISSYATDEMRTQVREAGAIDLLEKPFRMSHFATVLTDAMGGQPQRSVAGST